LARRSGNWRNRDIHAKKCNGRIPPILAVVGRQQAGDFDL